jgi:hypothetical protein
MGRDHLMECRVCGHEHMVWDDIHKEYAWKDTSPFIKIEGDYYYKDFLDRDEEVELFACPKCYVVQIKPKRPIR